MTDDGEVIVEQSEIQSTDMLRHQSGITKHRESAKKIGSSVGVESLYRNGDHTDQSTVQNWYFTSAKSPMEDLLDSSHKKKSRLKTQNAGTRQRNQ